MNNEGRRRKRSWPNLAHNSSTCLKGLKKTTNVSAHAIGVRGQNETGHLRARVISAVAWANLLGVKTHRAVLLILDVNTGRGWVIPSRPDALTEGKELHTIHILDRRLAGWVQSQSDRASQERSQRRSDLDSPVTQPVIKSLYELSYTGSRLVSDSYFESKFAALQFSDACNDQE